MAAADIDWSRGYEFLDKELQKVARRAVVGRRHVDKLIKVWRRSGEETWVLIHTEVQGKREKDFARRLYTYHSRLTDRYSRPVATLVVLTDDHPDWVLALPEALEEDYHRCIQAIEEAEHMQYVTTAERIGIRKGRQEGRRELLEQLLAARFGALPGAVAARLAEAESAQLAAWFQLALTAQSLEGVFADG